MIALEHHRQLTFLPPLAAEQECTLNLARRSGDAQARELLIISNLRLVAHLAKRYTWSGIDPEDLFSSGVLGLIAAVDSYDHDRGRLAPHARMHIRKEMLAHIAAHSTHHSDCIVTEDAAAAARFTRQVDSAAVYVNVSTRFTDGGEFGLGCEMGISTQKLHARGPMGLDELSTYNYVITGSGQIR